MKPIIYADIKPEKYIFYSGQIVSFLCLIKVIQSNAVKPRKKTRMIGDLIKTMALVMLSGLRANWPNNTAIEKSLVPMPPGTKEIMPIPVDRKLTIAVL